MKLKDLIAQLSRYPEDTEVAIFDWKRADLGEGVTPNISTPGVYTDFVVDTDMYGKQPEVILLSYENPWFETELGAKIRARVAESNGEITVDQVKDMIARDEGFAIITNSPGWNRWMAMIDQHNPYTVQGFINRAMELYAAARVQESRKYLKYDPFSDLQKVQLDYGYKKGELNPIALLGLFGEAGEVLNEVVFLNGGGILDREYSLAVLAAEMIDYSKKYIRDNSSMKPDVFITAEDDGKKFDLELADVVYYATLCALGRGRTLQYYAELSYNKVIAKGLKAPETDGKE